MATKIALLSEADASKIKQSHVAFLPAGLWRFIADGEYQSKISVCYEDANKLKHQFELKNEKNFASSGQRIFLVIEDGVKEHLTIYAEKLPNASSLTKSA